MTTSGKLTVALLLSLVACGDQPQKRAASSECHPKQRDCTGASPDGGNRTCERSADCAGLEVCDTEEGTCIPFGEAACASGRDRECARFDGLPFCVEERCEPAECFGDHDCAFMSATAACEDARCVDPSWECVGEPDERTVETKVGRYRLGVIDPLTGVMPADLTVRVCGSVNDLSCSTPPAGAVVRLEVAKNQLVIEGLAPKTSIHLVLSAANFFDTEFFSQRTVIGATAEPETIALIPKALANVGPVQNSVDTFVDYEYENNASVVARFFDCQTKPARGIALVASRYNVVEGESDTRTFYMKEGYLVDATATETDVFGAAGIVNLPAGKQVTLTANLGTRTVGSVALIPKAGWTTYLHFYPREYDE